MFVDLLWHVYMLRLQNDCIYVGLTDDLERRLAEHQSGNGGKTTSDSQPVTLIYSEPLPDRSAAPKRERQLKRWSRAKKLALAKGHFDALHRLAKRRRRPPKGFSRLFEPRLHLGEVAPLRQLELFVLIKRVVVLLIGLLHIGDIEMRLSRSRLEPDRPLELVDG